MPDRRLIQWILGVLVCASLVAACSTAGRSGDSLATLTPPPTPSAQILRATEDATSPYVRLTLRSVSLQARPLTVDVQLFCVLADPTGDFTYMVYPANRAGTATDQFEMTLFPLELNITERTDSVSLWVLALYNTRYYATEMLGLDVLANALASGYRDWLADGGSADDPLAAVVSRSEDQLFEWFAGVEVLGQATRSFTDDGSWTVPATSLRSSDNGLSVVYSMQPQQPEEDPSSFPTPPTATPESDSLTRPGYILRVNEMFSADSIYEWYEGGDSTYVNEVVDGAYQIRLTALETREFGNSWGSLENMWFEDYAVEAEVVLVQPDVVNAQYGLWFHYQEDAENFIYFGISNQGAYRVVIIQGNRTVREVQPWTAHPAIHAGAASNILSIETNRDGSITLGANGEDLITFGDVEFSGGTLAFFCRAESVPTTCRLEWVRVWEPLE